MAGGAFPTSLLAYPRKKSTSSVRSLSFYHEHTQETLTIDYFKQGMYSKKALGKINYFLRDFRSGDIHPISTDLIDMLYVISRDLRISRPFHIISGYRSPLTNGLLRKKKRNVAKHSYHMFGKAVDIKLPGMRLDKLRHAAMKLKAGGVGYYPDSAFVHVDVGPIRYW